MLFKTLGTKQWLNIGYHLETNVQKYIINQTLEDILKIYMDQRKNSWEEYFHLVKFA